jgi:acyl carrier protein
MEKSGNRERVLNRLREVLADDWGIEIEASETVQLDGLGLDSLEFLELMMKLEIPDEAIPRMQSIGDLVDQLSA